MPLVFSELAAVYPSSEVNDPVRSLAVANGQFLLIERDAYFSVGGHRAVGKDILEDVALARNVKRATASSAFATPPTLSPLDVPHAARDDRRLDQESRASLPQTHCPCPLAILDLLLVFGLPMLSLGIFWLVPWQRWAMLLIWLRTLWRFYARVARSNFPAIDVAISIFGVPLFVCLLLRSVIDHRIRKNVAWKGRSYNIRG